MEQVIASIVDRFETWSPLINTLGVAGTLILTLFLVVLYRQQKNLLRDNYNATHRAIVEVEDHSVDDETLFLDLSNVGNGVGMDLELITATVFQETDGLAPGVTTSRVRLNDEDVVRGRQSIKPHEDNVTFSARPSLGFSYADGQTDRLGMRLAMEELERAGVEVLRVHWFLRYRDPRDEFEVRYIKGVELDVSNEIESLEDLHTRGAGTVFNGLEIDPETLELDLSEAVTDEQRTVF